MGGQFNYWGLWLDSDYGKGQCSESCTTFRNYIQLGVNKNFVIRNIEVWAVGEKPVKEDVTILNFFIIFTFSCDLIFVFYVIFFLNTGWFTRTLSFGWEL